MPDRAEGARAVLRLVEILRESWIDFANRPESRAPSGFFQIGAGRVTVGVGESYRGAILPRPERRGLPRTGSK